MASTPVSSIASSATNVADVLASLGDDALAAEVGSWSAELQAKVVAAVSAMSSTPTTTSASTAVRRRKSNKLDVASSSAAASWLTPTEEPADPPAELTAVHEGEQSPAPTMTGDEVVTFSGNPPPVDFDLGDIAPATAGFLGGGGDAGGLSGADTGAGGLGSGEVVSVEDPQWAPRSLLAIIDGVDAARWALILVEVGREEDVNAFADWFVAKARGNPAKLDQVKRLWVKTTWAIALGMRAGRTFKEMAAEVVADTAMFNEAMAYVEPAPKRNPAGNHTNDDDFQTGAPRRVRGRGGRGQSPAQAQGL